MKRGLICTITFFTLLACSCAVKDSEPSAQNSDISTVTKMSDSQNSSIENSDADQSSSAPDIQKASDNLGDWLKENLWDIIGNINLTNIPEVCDYVNPRSAELYIADIDNDGSPELIHSLFTGSYTTINSVYKPQNNELVFCGYYYSGLITEASESVDGIYTNGSERKYFCSRYETSGGTGQPYWIRIYEMKFGSTIELVPLISGEWAPPTYDGKYRLVKAEYDSGIIYNEAEYDQWLSELLGGYTKAGNIENIADSMTVPFSIGFKDITSDEELQSIIDWICNGLAASEIQ